MITLGIDYGASNIGIALVRNTPDGGNIPLFAGTITLDARWLKGKVETRAGIRRLRRTRKTKKRRLDHLRKALASIGVNQQQAAAIARFSERRGYKSLFDEGRIEKDEKLAELSFRFTREDFFDSLESELASIIPDAPLRARALGICERVLNRDGNRGFEVRPIRIDNRGASRCAWEGCSHVTPRSENALRDVIAQQVYTFFQGGLKESPDQVQPTEEAIARLHELAKRLRHSSPEPPKEGEKKGKNKEAQRLRKKARAILADLRGRFCKPGGDLQVDGKAWKYIEGGILNIMEKRSGRTRYCREHSKLYVQTILSGKPAPFKQTIAESDIISRREQIAYAKMWRYLDARVLPLAPEGIDRVVVERTAFDLLAGSWKSIQKASPDFKEAMYQQGPMYGFSSVGEMLREEFGGLCAYCGGPFDELLDRDHILPRADFFFDSYLNLLPSCPKCNSEQKGRRSLSELSLCIHPSAYEAYSDYLRKKFSTRPMHFFHTIKKGILNLMKDPQRLWDAERYLSLIAGQFARIVQTQRSPRPFARYLSTKLSVKQGRLPGVRFRSGRHTSLYRGIAYPDFEKYADREEGGLSNHAIDALLLASDLPDPYPVDSLHIPLQVLRGWALAVRSRAPEPGRGGVPECPARDDWVDGFEKVNPGGYVEVELRAMCWNQEDSMTHKQDPYGGSEAQPAKRKAAPDVYSALQKLSDVGKVVQEVKLIHHPGLRKAVLEGIAEQSPGVSAAKALRQWLQVSVKNSISNSRFPDHPGDRERKAELEKFVASADCPIPGFIGVRMFDLGVRGKVDLVRIDKQTGGIGHRYMTQPSNRAVIVAYPRKKDGSADLGKPHCLSVRQNRAIKPEDGLAVFKANAPPPALSEGDVLGRKGGFQVDRSKALKAYLLGCGFHSYTYLTPGCVVRYEDGENWFVRNFKRGGDFKKSRLRNIVGVRRTPLAKRTVPLRVLT